MAGKMTKTMDMTVGEPVKLLMTFAIPLFIGNVFQMLYNTVDTIVVGRFVGAGAIAAVGACGPAYSIIVMVINGFTSGASIVISQEFGGGDREGVRIGYITSFKMIALTGTVFMFIGFLIGKPLLKLLGTPDDCMADAVTYLYWMFAGILGTCLYNGMAAFLRAVGNSFLPLIALIISSCLNIVLDLVFVLVFHWDVAGVAIATILSQFISGLFCLMYVNMKMGEFKFGLQEFKMDRSHAMEMVRLGLPAAFSTAVVTVSTMFIQRAVNGYGSTVMAAYTTNNKAEFICLSLSFSIGLATGVFAAQNKGAGKLDRVRIGLYTGIRISLIYHIAMGLFMYIGAVPLIRIFTGDAGVLEVAVPLVRITACFVPVLGLVFIFQNFLRNVSDVVPTIWMSGAEIISRAILPFVLSARFGYFGIWWATPVGWTLSFLIGLARYKSGKWIDKGLKGKEFAH